MAETKHTPRLPWGTGGIYNPDTRPRVSIWSAPKPGDQSGEIVACDVTIPNARLIVRAVNAHEDLVGALKQAETAITHLIEAGKLDVDMTARVGLFFYAQGRPCGAGEGGVLNNSNACLIYDTVAVVLHLVGLAQFIWGNWSDGMLAIILAVLYGNRADQLRKVEPCE